METIILVLLFTAAITTDSEARNEPHCSKYHCEEDILAKQVRMEHQMEIDEKEVHNCQQRVQSKLSELENLDDWNINTHTTVGKLS